MELPPTDMGSPANARFLDALGIDPAITTSEAVKIDILNPKQALIRWQGTKLVSLTDLRQALNDTEQDE